MAKQGEERFCKIEQFAIIKFCSDPILSPYFNFAEELIKRVPEGGIQKASPQEVISLVNNLYDYRYNKKANKMLDQKRNTESSARWLDLEE